MFDQLGGRKFVGFLFVMAAGILIEVYGKAGLSATAASFLVAMYTSFSAANVIATLKAPSSEADNSTQPNAQPAASPEAMAQVQAALVHLIDRQAANEQGLNGIQQAMGSLQKGMAAVISTRQ